MLEGSPLGPVLTTVKARLFSWYANKILCPAAYLMNKMNTVSSAKYCKLYSTYRVKVKTNSLLAMLGKNVLLLSMTYKPRLQATISSASHSPCITVVQTSPCPQFSPSSSAQTSMTLVPLLVFRARLVLLLYQAKYH